MSGLYERWAANEPLPKLTGSGRKHRGNADRRRTMCKRCGWMLSYDEASVWLTNPMGLSHQVCPEREAS